MQGAAKRGILEVFKRAATQQPVPKTPERRRADFHHGLLGPLRGMHVVEAQVKSVPVLAILGPTAAGKSALGLDLAESLGGEILCCDSMQVYRGMDVGTGKPTAKEQATVPHHLLDLVDPHEHFHAAAWAERARAAILGCTQRERLPIIVGGTGLYYRALVRGLFEAPRPDAAIRARHQQISATLGVATLYARLVEVDPATAAKILPGDFFRISRALEIFEQTGTPISELRRQTPLPNPPLRVFSVFLDYPMEELRQRIRARVEAMMAAGFLEEVKALRAAGHGRTRPMAGLGYKQLGAFLDGGLSLEEAVEETKVATATYARRQRTWFRGEAITFRTQTPPYPEAMAHLVRGWLV